MVCTSYFKKGKSCYIEIQLDTLGNSQTHTETYQQMSSNIRIKRICEFCSNEFEAKTTVTKYCGDTCAKKGYKARKRSEKIEGSDKQVKQVLLRPIEEIKTKDFLSIAEACKLIGVSRMTIYRSIGRGVLKAGKIGRRTIIRRSELENIFEPFTQPQHSESDLLEPIAFSESEFYNLTEVQQKYGISEKALQEIIKREQIPKVRMAKFAYVPKNRIDEIFL
jgi:excisionase family DNA binding protein